MARVAIVTGGTRGIGEAISLALKDMGVTVAANYAGNDEKAKAFTERTGIAAFKWDVGDFEATQAGVKQVEEAIGPVDIVVNNAGITRDGTLLTASPIRNVAGRHPTQTSAPASTCAKGGDRRHAQTAISAASSTSDRSTARPASTGRSTTPLPSRAFTASPRPWRRKALPRFGITVNAIAPGYIDTDMVAAVPADVLEKIVAKIPVGRLGQASEIARGVAFLCSEEGGFVTGSTLSINGGQHMY